MKWLEGFSLDLKLGGRMLVKYPGLTIVGGLAMAFAICVGAVIFEVLTLFVHPTLPLPAASASSRSGTGTSRRMIPSRARCTTSSSGAARCGR